MGEVIQLRPSHRSCDQCLNALLGMQGTFCLLFNEIVDEREADSCDAYEPT